MLNSYQLRKLAESWLEEDGILGLDYAGGAIGADRSDEVTAVLLAKSEGILAGFPFLQAVFQVLGCHVDILMPGDGDSVTSGQRLAEVRGHPRDILLGERAALNCLCRASGIATQARRIKEMVARDVPSWTGSLAGTRKTTPGFRLVEKYSLLVGGVDPHRYDLPSMVMLKDNHVWAAGNVRTAINNCRKNCSFTMKIEVECRSLQEARDAAEAGCDIVMLDNFSPVIAKSVSEALKTEFPHLLIEASGGINDGNVLQFVHSTIDIISMSQLTQGYPVLDFSLKIVKDGHDPHNPTVTHA